jgi:hypothetical protein
MMAEIGLKLDSWTYAILSASAFAGFFFMSPDTGQTELDDLGDCA